MVMLPRRTVDDSHWYTVDEDGTVTWLPACSADYTPSGPRWTACLLDPGGPICRRHSKFFLNKKGKK